MSTKDDIVRRARRIFGDRLLGLFAFGSRVIRGNQLVVVEVLFSSHAGEPGGQLGFRFFVCRHEIRPLSDRQALWARRWRAPSFVLWVIGETTDLPVSHRIAP